MNGDDKLTPPDLKMAAGPGEPPEFPVAPAPSALRPESESDSGRTTPPPAPQPDFFSPETIGPSPVPEGVAGERSRALKTVAMILGAVVFVAGLGALSYFIIFPLIFSGQQIERPPVVTEPIASTHKSFLVSSPAAEAEIKLSNTGYQAIAAALQNESFNQLADGQYKEVKVSDANGQVAFANYLSAIAPATSALGATDWFEADFTALLYYDATGVWPIYVAKLKAGVDSEAVKSGFRTLENIMELPNFYLAPPGTFSAFKDGKAGNYSTRYSVGTQIGAAFNYGVLGNYLIVSTNYNGLKGALPLLGL